MSTKVKEAEAVVTHYGIFDCQVCVPEGWTDAEVKAFADRSNPAGTTNGWQIRKEGDEALAGVAERVACAGRGGFVHIMLDA